MRRDKQPSFKPIDLNKWPRKPYFDQFYNKTKCTYSISADIEIESLLKFCKTQSIKLYPAMIHIITSVVNDMEELRTTVDEDGVLGIWDSMSPCYAHFHNDDKTFTNIWTPYSSDLMRFNADYVKDIETYGRVKAFYAKGDEPGYTFPISCIPWLDFTALNLNIYDDGRYLSPIFTFGKYTIKDGKKVIPLAVQLHHALCDGYHVSQLFEKIRALAAGICDAPAWAS